MDATAPSGKYLCVPVGDKVLSWVIVCCTRHFNGFVVAVYPYRTVLCMDQSPWLDVGNVLVVECALIEVPECQMMSPDLY